MQNHSYHKLGLRVVSGLAIIIITFGAGLYIGSDIGSNQATAESRIDLTSFWKAYDILETRFVKVKSSSSTPVTDRAKVEGAIKGLVESYGDPYTVFFPAQELKSFQEDIRGNFEGVGMEVGIKDGVLTVVSPLKGTPAEKSGIIAGDRIVSINGTSTKDMSVDAAIKLIRGKAGTVVTLEILRGDDRELRKINITRGVINLPTVESELRKDSVFVIKLYSFSSIASSEFRKALKEFVGSKSNKLVLDLRNNPGGYLDASVDIASWFLPAGKVIVQEDFGTAKEKQILRSKGYNIFDKKLKMVVLINGGSASASEILAGALSEHGIARTVGAKSFGKGSVQELIPLTEDTSVKVTIARWLTPNGNTISEKGIVPDVVVEVTEEDIKAGKDPQLEEAVRILKGN